MEVSPNNWSCSLLLLGLCWWHECTHSEARCFLSIWRQTNEKWQILHTWFPYSWIGHRLSSLLRLQTYPMNWFYWNPFRNQAYYSYSCSKQTPLWVQSHDFAGRFAYAWFPRQHLFYLSRSLVAYVSVEHKHSRHPSWAVGCLLVCRYNTDWHCETFPFQILQSCCL